MLPEGPVLSAVLETARDEEDTDLLLLLANGLLQVQSHTSFSRKG
jgi:hypothetical protein